MQKLLITTAQGCALFAAMAIASGPAQAAVFDNWYGKVSAGVSANAEVAGLELEDGLSAGAAIGTDFGPLRIEAGADHIGHTLNLGGAEADASAIYASGTVYADFKATDNIGLFIGAGGGLANAEASLFGTNVTGDGLAWHVKAGAAARMNDRMIFEVAVTHIEADLDFDVGGGQVNADYTSNFVGAGIRFAF
mgnify:CR=1 FL=1